MCVNMYAHVCDYIIHTDCVCVCVCLAQCNSDCVCVCVCLMQYNSECVYVQHWHSLSL